LAFEATPWIIERIDWQAAFVLFGSAAAVRFPPLPHRACAMSPRQRKVRRPHVGPHSLAAMGGALQLWVPVWLFTALPPQLLLSSTRSEDAGRLLPQAGRPAAEEATDRDRAMDVDENETEPRAAVATQLEALEGGDGERRAEAEDETEERGRLLPRPDRSAGEAQGLPAALSTSLAQARGLLPLLRRKVGRERPARTLAVEGTPSQ